jgi:hypothetical protein
MQLRVGRDRLLAGVALYALSMACWAAPPPPPPPPPPAAAPAPTQGAPDDDLIEFLGGDDVGDTAWWEFLKKVPPRGDSPPVTPPQDTKQ